MAGGRPPKPVEQKRREGNPGKRKLPDSVLVGGRLEPKAPSKLTPRARAVWKELIPQLQSAGVIDHVDRLCLEALCESAALMREARDQMAKEPLVVEGSTGQPRRNPLIDIFVQAQAEVRRWADLFGLHPSGRARLGLQVVKGLSLEAELDKQLGDQGLGKAPKKVDAEAVAVEFFRS